MRVLVHGRAVNQPTSAAHVGPMCDALEALNRLASLVPRSSTGDKAAVAAQVRVDIDIVRAAITDRTPTNVGDVERDIAREAYRYLHPGPVNLSDAARSAETDVIEADDAYRKWDEGRAGYAPTRQCQGLAAWLISHVEGLADQGTANDGHARTRAADEVPTSVSFTVQDGWPTPNNCRRAAEGIDQISLAKYGDILRAYADAEEVRSSTHGPILRARSSAGEKDRHRLPLHRTEAGYPRCSTCGGGGCPDCTDPA